MLIDNKVVVLFTEKQAKRLDEYRVELKYSQMFCDTLQKRLQRCDTLASFQRKYIEAFKQQIDKYDLLIYNDDLLINEQKEQIKDLENTLQKIKRRKRLQTMLFIPLLALSGVLLLK